MAEPQCPSSRMPNPSAESRRPAVMWRSSTGQIREAFETRLILENLELAEALAFRFTGRGREQEDLNQVAYLGLVKAARRFDPSKGDSFAAYASPTVTGELKRYLRDRCWVIRPPRRIQDLRTEVLRTEPELTQALGHRPSPDQLAQQLGVPVSAVREAQAAASSMRPDSLDGVDTHDDGPRLADALASRELPLERLEDLLWLHRAIGELSEQERELLYRRYFCEESQAELGRRFGVSQMQVSRRLSKVLMRLQRLLTEADSQSSPRTRTASRTS
jgi:RNA polymerase sigma-B factor